MKNGSILGNFIAQLRRRDVIKTCVAYLGVSWVLLQVLDVASQMLIVDVIVGTFMFIFLLCLFPVVLYISWHFQFTGKGWVRTTATDTDEDGEPIPVAPLGWGSWAGLATTVSLCLLLGFQYFHVVKDRLAKEQDGIVQAIKADSIAVLPFEDQSADKDQAYLSVGLAEELTSLLGQTDGFKVAASRSSQILSEKGMAPVDIGRRLNVQTVLTGSVVNIGNRVKVRVELLDTGNGHTVWTETFLRELKDIFDLQAEIGRSLVNTLQDKYLESGSLRSLNATSSTDAYVINLKAREQYRLQTTESFKQARKLYEQAIALDPEYAQAYVGLADTIALLGDGPTQYGVLDNEIAATLSQGYIEKAIIREPNSPHAFAVLGYIKLIRKQYEDAIGAFDKAIQLNPSLAIAYMWKYRALMDIQRFEESLQALEKAIELDPLFRTATHNLGFELVRRGQYEEARKIFEQLKTDYPNYPDSFIGLSEIYFNKGNFADAFKQVFQAHQLSPNDEEILHRNIGILSQLGLANIIKELTSLPEVETTILLLEGNYDSLFKEMDFAVAANPDDYWISFEAGWYHSLVGEKDKAISYISQNHISIVDADMFSMPWCSPAIEIAWAKIQVKDIETAQSNLTQCETLATDQLDSDIKYHELNYLMARIAALNEDKDKALLQLELAVNNGWREWWTDKDPLMEILYTEEKFKTLMTIINDDLKQQRQDVQNYYNNLKTVQ